MSNKPRPIPGPAFPSRKSTPQPETAVPARDEPQGTTDDPVFLQLYYRAIQGLVQRSDLEWHPAHLSRRALEYAHAAYKELKGL